LQRGVALAREEFETVVDKSLVQEDTPLLQEVSTVTDDLDTTLRFIAVETGKNVVVGQNITLLDLDTVWCPCADKLVVVLFLTLVETQTCRREETNLVITDGYRVVNNVSNGSKLLVHLLLLCIRDCF